MVSRSHGVEEVHRHLCAVQLPAVNSPCFSLRPSCSHKHCFSPGHCCSPSHCCNHSSLGSKNGGSSSSFFAPKGSLSLCSNNGSRHQLLEPLRRVLDDLEEEVVGAVGARGDVGVDVGQDTCPRPMPTDCLRDVPVGGRLQRFAAEWEAVTSDVWVLSIVKHGYRLEFASSPPPFEGIRTTAVPKHPVKKKALLDEVQALLEKNAVVQVSGEVRVGHYASFFLTPKKSGEWRPIINLKPLNFFVRPQPFRMETLAAVLQVLGPGYWGATLDLKDAYLHVPIHPQSRKFLRFALQGRTFEFKVLPFGLASSPRVFTRVVKTVAEFLRPRGFTLFVYLDDFLVVSRSQLALQRDLLEILALLARLGFIVNWKKSKLTPSQQVQFLGAQLDLAQGIVRPTVPRMMDVMACALRILSATSVQARLMLRFLGLLASLVDVVPLCRLRMRVIQLHLSAYYRPWAHPLHQPVPVSALLRRALTWWMCIAHLQTGIPFPPPTPSLILTTDASKVGWGAHLLERHLSGLWSPHQAQYHINILELWAVHLALRQLGPRVKGRFILVRTDNMSVVAYLNKEGGTRSPSLCQQVIRLLTWCQERGIRLRGEHVPGVDNLVADALSRGGPQSSVVRRVRGSSVEWHLNPRVCQAIFAQLDRPHVDLFASRFNNQLPTYFAWGVDHQALGSDAFTQDWSGLLAYAFPPVALIPRVLLKLSQTGSCLLLLVAPMWPRQLWFPRLLELVVAEPVRLPLTPDLLLTSGTRQRIPMRTVQALHLTVWRISADPLRRRDFLTQLPISHCRQGDVQPDILTLPDFSGSRGGVPIMRVCPILHL